MDNYQHEHSRPRLSASAKASARHMRQDLGVAEGEAGRGDKLQRESSLNTNGLIN